MYLTRHATLNGERWAVDGRFLPDKMKLGVILELPAATIAQVLADAQTAEIVSGELLAPIEPNQEVWAAGVTYLRSREARKAESKTADIYDKVYDAERVEIFFKALGTRVIGDGQAVRVRRDSQWNVPEPELTMVLNSAGEIVGYTAGNDMSSRDIEGENPLYLPQAKVYDGSCAIGPGIVIANARRQRSLPIRMIITRNLKVEFQSETSTDQLKRSLEEMATWLTRELTFEQGVFLMTGTCLVPPDEFSLQVGDRVRIEVGELVLENSVSA
ncbi:fumarylacetoacetate hydrolase family protein [Pseudomonadota bacterium]